MYFYTNFNSKNLRVFLVHRCLIFKVHTLSSRQLCYLTTHFLFCQLLFLPFFQRFRVFLESFYHILNLHKQKTPYMLILHNEIFYYLFIRSIRELTLLLHHPLRDSFPLSSICGTCLINKKREGAEALPYIRE